MIRVFLLDDHELTRTGFRYILEHEQDITVVGESGNGEDALIQVRRLRPDLLLCDIYLPGLSGLEVTERIVGASIGTRVIGLSAQDEGPLPRRVLAAGAYGYLCKGCGAREMLRAVRTVASGHRYIAGIVAQQLALESLSPTPGSPFDALSTRELELVLLLAQGYKVREIAERLNLSGKTVSSHKYNAFEKLGVRDLGSLMKLALQHSLLDPVTV